MGELRCNHSPSGLYPRDARILQYLQINQCNTLLGAGETFHSWQRSWGRRLSIRKGGLSLGSAPGYSWASTPKNSVCLLYCFVLSPLTLLGAVLQHHLCLHLLWLLAWCPAGSRPETFHSWQRSWGRGLSIRKGGIEPRECPRIFSSIYPQKPESAYFIALCSHLWLYWGLSPITISLSLSKS